MLNYVKFILMYLFVLTLMIIMGCAKIPENIPPTDKEMIAIFSDNKEVFDALKENIYKDGYTVISITPEWSEPEEIPLAKKDIYYELLQKIKALQIIRRGETVTISIWATGNVSGGDSKGYVFKPNDSKWPRDSKDSLDNLSFDGNELFLKCEIGNNWYLYFDHSL